MLNIWTSAVAQRLWAGVPIFFVISGYCISATIDKQRRAGISVGTYFLRRFRRIFPPFWVTLLATTTIVGAVDLAVPGVLTRNGIFLRPWWYSGWQWAGTATLTEIWRWHLIGGQKALLLGHAWTLCYEEQFYAVTGLLLALCPRRYFSGAVVVTLGVLGIVGWASWSSTPIDGFFFDGNWILFAFGVLVYHTLNYGNRAERWVASAAFAGVFIGAVSFGSALLAPAKNNPQVYAVASLFALAALWLRPYDEVLCSTAWLKPLRTCGLMCYSLYLVHLPVADLVKAGLAAGGVALTTLSPFVSLVLCGVPSIWVAWKFHLTVERRFMSASARPYSTSYVSANEISTATVRTPYVESAIN
jgi:peptidoglycan/LPS O-acetylase OafA/YrhL